MGPVRSMIAAALIAACGTTGTNTRPGTADVASEVAAPEVGRVAAPAGIFMMGSPAGERDRDPDEGPRIEVRVEGFEIDRTPVTVRAFEMRMGELHLDGSQAHWWLENETPSSWLGKCNLGSGRKEHPVNCITWTAARAYCQLAGDDLPTEAEWEYAARAGSKTAYPWGSTFKPAHVVSSVQCAMRGCRGSTAPVTTTGPRCNAWGVCDAIGNVWEWTLTDYAEQLGPYVSTTAAALPARPVHRGGAWLNEVSMLFRSAHRGLNYPAHGLTGVGFRCVRRGTELPADGKTIAR